MNEFVQTEIIVAAFILSGYNAKSVWIFFYRNIFIVRGSFTPRIF